MHLFGIFLYEIYAGSRKNYDFIEAWGANQNHVSFGSRRPNETFLPGLRVPSSPIINSVYLD